MHLLSDTALHIVLPDHALPRGIQILHLHASSHAAYLEVFMV